QHLFRAGQRPRRHRRHAKQDQGPRRHGARPHERSHRPHRQHGCDGRRRPGLKRKPRASGPGMGRRANEPAARAHHQRLDRQRRRHASGEIDRARHAAAARAGARCRRARAMRARMGAQGRGDLAHGRSDGARRSRAAAVLGQGGRAGRSDLYPSRRQSRPPLQAFSSLEQRRPGIRGGDGVSVADVGRLARNVPAAENLRVARRRLHAVLYGPHRSQLRRKGQHPRQHEQAADRLSAHALFRLLRLRARGAAAPGGQGGGGAGAARLGLPRGRSKAGRIRDRYRHAVADPARGNRGSQRGGAARPGKSVAAPTRGRLATQHGSRLCSAPSGPKVSQHGRKMMDERLLNPISTRELERRWAAVRKAMAERKIDVLVMQNSNDWLGGYVRWFTDTPLSNGHPRSVVLPASDLMTVVDMGARGGRRKINDSDEANRGVGETIFTPAFTSVAYTDEYQAELVAEELKRRGYHTIGWIASGAMLHKFVARIERELAGKAKFVDATEFVDRLKAIKSDEERGLIRKAAEMQDEVFTRVLNK